MQINTLLVLFVVLLRLHSSTLGLKRPHQHLLNNINVVSSTLHHPTHLWTPQLVTNCIFRSGTQRVFAVEMRTPEYSNVWERQLRLSSLPTEIQSRVRCQGWYSDGDASGGQGPVPPTPSCVVDLRYLVGSKRTMLAATLSLRSASTFYQHANMLILGLGGGTQPMQMRSLFPASTVTAVELDASVVTLAQKCFGFPHADPKLRVVVDDAVSFVSKSAASIRHTTFQTYNLIINDIANNLLSMGSIGSSVHDSMHTEQFFNDIRQLLTSNGLFIMNQLMIMKGDDTTHTELEIISMIEQNMKKAGFKTTRALLNDKVGRAILIGSVIEEQFEFMKTLKENCAELGLSESKGERWRNVDILTHELSAFV